MTLPITLQATSEAQLNTDIDQANSASSGTYVIDVSSFVENADLTAIDLKSGVNLTINGGSPSTYIDGDGNYRGLFVYSGAVTIENLTLQDMTAAGGNGASGGGGGAGLGGALFVANGGAATLSNVDMSGDKAVGGGGSASTGLLGGGGGMGGNGAAGGGGGEGTSSSGGGGGGGGGGLGVSASGGGGAWSGKSASGGQQSDILSGAGGGAGGASGRAVTQLVSDGMGGFYSQTEFYSGGYGGAGGGLGGSPGAPGVGNPENSGSSGGTGGVGGFGGGGGGAGEGEIADDHTHFLTTGGKGGQGGFGGGGGGGATGGSGGFGGGGGEGVKGSSAPSAAGGFGGGAGNGSGGGGGLGAGGDIFVQSGGLLNILGGELDEGTVTGGGSVYATPGDAYGGGIFLQGDETITLGAGGAAGSVTTIEGDIADETGNGGGSANPGAGSINIAGKGKVIFEGAATYTGTTDVEKGATLQVGTGGAGGGFNPSGALTVDGEMIVDLSVDLKTSATLSGSGEIVKVGSGNLTFKGAGSGFSGVLELRSGELIVADNSGLGSGDILFDGAATLALPNSTTANKIENFQSDDTIDLIGFGAYLPAAPHIALPASFTLAISDDTVTQKNSDGSKEVTTYDITDQSFTTKVLDYDQKGLIVAKYYENVTGQGNLSAFEYLYGGNNLIGTDNYYSGITGQSYTAEEADYDGDSRLTRAVYSDVSGKPYSSFEYDYVGGVFSGSKFTYTTVPSGATYSSYQVDYDWANAYAGETFFFTDVTGQSYTGEEEDFDSNSKLSRAVLTGVTGQAYYQLEEDYDAGVYAGYKAYYLISGQPYANEEVDVSAGGKIEKVVYSGMTSTPYSSVEEDYSSGSVSTIIYGYSDVTGETYYAYDVGDNSGGTGEQEAFDLNTGSHNLTALTSGQTLTSLGLDKMTGDGATTFVLDAIYGADVITNFNSADKVSLPTQEYAQLSEAISKGNYAGGNATLSFSDHDTLTFKNMTEATLQSLSGSFTSHS